MNLKYQMPLFVPKKLNELVINLCCVAIDSYLALLPMVKEHGHLFTNKSELLSNINREIAEAYNCINRCVNIGFVLFEEPRKWSTKIADLESILHSLKHHFCK